MREGLPYPSQPFNTIHIWHVDVHEHYIRFVEFDFLKYIGAISCRSHKLHFRGQFYQSLQAVASRLIIIIYKYPDGHSVKIHSTTTGRLPNFSEPFIRCYSWSALRAMIFSSGKKAVIVVPLPLLSIRHSPSIAAALDL